MNERPQVPFLRHFDYEDLGEPQRTTAARYAALARMVGETVPHGSDKDAALRKLLKSRAAALRAHDDEPEG